MKHILRMSVLALLALVIAASANAGTIYKWTAADGTVNYGQLPPRGANAVPVDGAPAPPPSVPPSDGQQTNGTRHETPEPARNEVRADDEEGMAAACDNARENIAILENPDVQHVRDGSGEGRKLEPEERQSRLQENREFLEKWC